jgi:hypothetical protein
VSTKDPALDRLLRQAAQRAAAPDGCPDAEQLAAFVSGSLRGSERDACEAHIAACARCLPLVATLARVEEAPARGVAWWRPANWTWWLVPATAVATAVALWVNVAPEREREQAERTMAPSPVDQRAAADTAPSAPSPSLNEELQKKTADAAKAPTVAREAPQSALGAGVRDSESARRNAQRQPPREEKALAPPPPAARAGTSAPSAAPPAPGAVVVTTAPPSQVPTQQQLPIVPPAPQQVQEQARARARTELERARADDITSLYRPAEAKIEIASSDPAIRWRVSGNTIERTTNGGSTWTAQFTAALPLAAGAAPSPSVAWIVGRGGTVLLTIDGQQWQRAPFPEIVDLVAVRARSDREADVTTADRRVFRTTDGGNTWRLQETPAGPF